MAQKFRGTTFLLGVTLAVSTAFAQIAPTGEPSAATGWRADTVVEDIPHPWSITWLPDGRPLITSKAGKLLILNGERLDTIPLEGLPPVFTSGQGGCSTSRCIRPIRSIRVST